ncbi:MAG: EAL domain-containing protein [Nitrospirota bacterium]
MRDENRTKDSLIKELSELRQKLAELKALKADNDSLTGLPNRALLYDRLSQALLQAGRKGSVVAVMFLFLHDLKLINDTFGHTSGNSLLKAFAGRLKRSLRKSDTVARPGRNEFIILLPEIARPEDAMVVAEKIISAFDSPFVIGEQEIFMNISIGISLYASDGLDSGTLLKNAYTAMNNAKEEGKNKYLFFSKAMNDKAFERLAKESSLRLALKRKEFVLYYQPQVDVKAKRIIGMEALIRWKRPGFSLVPPSDFIHDAEDNGLIVPIGDWSLLEACRQQKAWQKAGIAPERMAVNMSAKQFRQGNIIEKIIKVLKKTGLQPDSLELELTESAVFQNVGDTVGKLMKLKDMGVNISIDDFGTGYSSLSYLRDFPINKLKIVSSFVRSISISAVDSAIAKLIIDLSRVLNLKVIAEGVETEEQLEFLRTSGCNEIQGFLLSIPLNAEEATRLLTEKKDFKKMI